MKGLFAILMLFLAACGSSVTAGLMPPEHNQQEIDFRTPGYTQVLNAVFALRCNGCHSGFASYEGARASLQSIRDQVATNRMPKNGAPLTPDQKEILFAWIDAGGPKDPAP